MARWHIATRETRVAYQTSYRATHQEKIKARAAQHYVANRESISAKKTAWASAHREPINARAAKYRAINREADRLRLSKWQRDNSARLGDSYIKRLLKQNLPRKDVVISPSLVEAKRALLKLERVLRLLAKNDTCELELQMTAFSIGDLEREIKNANLMRRNKRDASGGNDRPSSKKDRP